MQLELGSGDRPYPGYTHQDIRSLPDIEFICDARDILNYVPANSCTKVRACHLLEHFSYTETVSILRIWWQLLNTGGSIYLEVPNLEWQAEALLSGEIDEEMAVYYIFGGHRKDEFDVHMAGFTTTLLKKKMREADFENITLVADGDPPAVICAEGYRLA